MITASSIRTPRLRLEPLTVRDTDALFPVLDDPALHTFTGGEPRTRAELQAWITAVEPGRSPDGTQSWCNWVVVVVETGSVAGTVQATVEREDASLAWVIGAAFQGHGYAKEAAAAMACVAHRSGRRPLPARRSIRTMRRRDRSPIRWGCGPPTSSLTAKSCGVRPGYRPPTPPPRDNPRASGAHDRPAPGSSNGKTRAFGAWNGGSIPPPGTTIQRRPECISAGQLLMYAVGRDGVVGLRGSPRSHPERSGIAQHGGGLQVRGPQGVEPSGWEK